ncbi:hypothetical protein H0H92_011674, partial [Tricholoma furcatifolium]
ERDLLEYEDAWRSIPILVDAAGNVLLTAVHSKSLDLNRKAKSKKKGKTKEISQDIIDDTDDDTDAETEPRPESSKGKGKDKGKKRRVEEDESDDEVTDLPQKRARVPPVPSVGSSTDVQKTLAQMQELLKKAGISFQ